MTRDMYNVADRKKSHVMTSQLSYKELKSQFL